MNPLLQLLSPQYFSNFRIFLLTRNHFCGSSAIHFIPASLSNKLRKDIFFSLTICRICTHTCLWLYSSIILILVLLTSSLLIPTPPVTLPHIWDAYNPLLTAHHVKVVSLMRLVRSMIDRNYFYSSANLSWIYVSSIILALISSLVRSLVLLELNSVRVLRSASPSLKYLS